jgi:hypothetical protein
MTIGERRVWEYHNELVGGTARAAFMPSATKASTSVSVPMKSPTSIATS